MRKYSPSPNTTTKNKQTNKQKQQQKNTHMNNYDAVISAYLKNVLRLKNLNCRGVHTEFPPLWFNLDVLRDTISTFVILNEYNFHLKFRRQPTETNIHESKPRCQSPVRVNGIIRIAPNRAESCRIVPRYVRTASRELWIISKTSAVRNNAT